MAREHSVLPPDPNIELELRRFEQGSKYRLPSGLVEFYRMCGGAQIFDSTILPLTGIKPTGVAMLNDPNSCTASWYSFCEHQDGDHVGIDLDPTLANPYPILDHNHEDIERAPVIAESIVQFFSLLLGSEERYWLAHSFKPARVLVFEEPDLEPGKPWEHLGPENGPAICNTPRCTKKTISLSSKCQEHHYKMMRAARSPRKKGK